MSDHARRTYDYCLRFFAEVRALGVTRAIVSPGSRSTPLAIAARAAGLDITVQLDERVAAFHALGHAKATGMPSLLICTSGTAGANYLPAVVEAHHTGVPMIICTADRPPELRRWGAGQTIEQLHLFGHNVRWFQELPVPSEVDADQATAVALRAVVTAIHEGGPVHLNWPLREPLEPNEEPQAPAASLAAAEPRPPSPRSALLAELAARHDRGLVVAGPASLPPDAVDQLTAFCTRWGWPLIADPASGLRGTEGPVITTGELLLAASPFTERTPAADVVVRVGAAPTSKAYRLWLETTRPARLVLVAPGVEWADPTASVTDVVAGPVDGVFAGSPGPARTSSWLDLWVDAEERAAKASEDFLSSDRSELAAARAVVAGLVAAGEPATLMVSNSMPIRDLDVAARPMPASLEVIANRGANGIDGIIATATGHAEATGVTTVALVGDVAAVHDLGGVAAAARLGAANLTIVVIDNNAGGIFSFLPISQSVDSDSFTSLFATPHGTDLEAVASALGLQTYAVDEPSELMALLSGPPADDSVRLVLFSTTVGATTAAMAGLRNAVHEALMGAGV